MLGANAEQQRHAGIRQVHFGKIDGDAGADGDAPGIDADMGLEDVHGGRADEPGDEHAGRLRIDFHRRVDLLRLAFIHDDETVGERHGFDLIVRDIERCRADVALQGLDLEAHLHPQFGIEIGQRLIEQEGRRIAHQGAAHRDPLPLAA